MMTIAELRRALRSKDISNVGVMFALNSDTEDVLYTSKASILDAISGYASGDYTNAEIVQGDTILIG